MTLGHAMFFQTLATYLNHFAGRTATPVTAFGPMITHWPHTRARLMTAIGRDGDRARFTTSSPSSTAPRPTGMAGLAHHAGPDMSTVLSSDGTKIAYEVTGDGPPLPEDRWPAVTMPTLVADGGKSPDYMRASAAAVASVLPNATYQTIPGQTHIIKAKALAPVLRDFLLR
jgi:pimeloyl-ACP methyl ester carboxylesterase